MHTLSRKTSKIKVGTLPSGKTFNYRAPSNTISDLNFLGFNIRQHEVGKTHSAKDSKGRTLGFKTLIKPSKEAIQRHYQEICKIINAHKSAPQEALINHLNPVIRGWGNYYSTVVSKEIFSDLDRLILQKLQRWAKRRHPGKSKTWVSKKYWGTVGNDNWVFRTKHGLTLLKHSATKIIRHVKVQGTNSPFDGNLVYWSQRQGKNPLLPTRVTNLLKQQEGKCPHCELYFRETDVMEVDHIIPKSRMWKG
ncbi:group II intron maturase-specific domain-containing protein [Fischerella sp. PCC 9605]|uniref:group II intron maturase-specific domain-containing protein n=1 Tax=Fischerella sp. PCC 9605 TaxID=1173024 RepID=UPI003FA45B67